MSSKHKTWAWMKPKGTTMGLLLLLLGGIFDGMRNIRRSNRAVMGGEEVGFVVAVAGGFVAFATLVGIFFVPVATFTVFDQELGAAIGVLMLVLGIGIAAASK